MSLKETAALISGVGFICLAGYLFLYLKTNGEKFKESETLEVQDPQKLTLENKKLISDVKITKTQFVMGFLLIADGIIFLLLLVGILANL